MTGDYSISLIFWGGELCRYWGGAFFPSIIVLIIVFSLPAVMLVASLAVVNRSASGSPQFFSVRVWRVMFLLSILGFVCIQIPYDYWHNPPGSGFPRVPDRANVVACYSMSLDLSCPTNAFMARTPVEYGCCPHFWPARRGFDAYLGKNIGERDLKLEAVVDAAGLTSGFHFVYVIFRKSHGLQAAVFSPTGGGSSGSWGAMALLADCTDGNWIIKKTDHEYFSDGLPMDALDPVTRPSTVWMLASLFLVAKALISRCVARNTLQRIPFKIIGLMTMSSVFFNMTTFAAGFIARDFRFLYSVCLGNRSEPDWWRFYAIVAAAAIVLSAISYVLFRIAKRCEERRAVQGP